MTPKKVRHITLMVPYRPSSHNVAPLRLVGTYILTNVWKRYTLLYKINSDFSAN